MDSKIILDILYDARKDAEEQDIYNGYNFNSDKYEWELGIEIAGILRSTCCCYYSGAFDTILQCMGINVRINYENPKIIKLWKKNYEVIL